MHSPHSVFTNYEVDMSRMAWIGFDYDYTLAKYTSDLLPWIYNWLKRELVQKSGYPDLLLRRHYDPDFAIRGLAFDVRNGFLIKQDYAHNVGVGYVYFGRRPLSYKEIHDAYNGIHISRAYNEHLRLMADMFAKPVSCLLADVVQVMVESGIAFEPKYVYQDVEKAVSRLHVEGHVHQAVMENLDMFLEPSPSIGVLLKQFRQAGKRLFLLTNSSFRFVDSGMRHLLQHNAGDTDDWCSLFDVIMCRANKPQFYTEKRSFRELDVNTGKKMWTKVDAMQKGRVYLEGSLAEFRRLALDHHPGQVLYFGDHIFSDLKEPNRASGWSTGSIILEIEDEVRAQLSPVYQENLGELLKVNSELRQLWLTGALTGDADHQRVAELISAREQHREMLKQFFNTSWGSVFRTHTGPSRFGHAVGRYCDLYTAKVENLLGVDAARHCFIPMRTVMPHEPLPIVPIGSAVDEVLPRLHIPDSEAPVP